MCGIARTSDTLSRQPPVFRRQPVQASCRPEPVACTQTVKPRFDAGKQKERKMNQDQTSRRQFLKIGGATLVVIPLGVASGGAGAATNAALRGALKYQDKPEGDKSCSNCMQFVPGPSANAPGGCKVLPGDTEISPQAYCTAWVKKP
jgi:hypothetical protein